MQAYVVIVSEDDDINIRECDIGAKHVIVTAQVPNAKENEGKIAVGVAPATRTDMFVAVPQNSLWFPDMGMAASYLKGMVEDTNLATTLKLKPLTTASGVLIINAFAEPHIHDGILDVQMHAYPQQYVPLKELIPAMTRAAEALRPDAVIDVERTPNDETTISEPKVVSIGSARAETVTVDAEVKDVTE